METLRPPLVPLGGVASFSRPSYPIFETISFFHEEEEEEEFDRLERFSANILLPYHLDINIAYIISSRIIVEYYRT